MSSFYDKGLKFECQRCSFCCGHSPGYVYLSHADLNLLCEFFSMSEVEFIKINCRWVEYYGGTEVLALKEKQNYDCWLWKNGCSAYGARPVQCRTYPFWSWMIRNKEMWEDCAKDCPGMNKGKTWTFEEIEKQRSLYDNNKPIDFSEYEAALKARSDDKK